MTFLASLLHTSPFCVGFPDFVTLYETESEVGGGGGGCLRVRFVLIRKTNFLLVSGMLHLMSFSLSLFFQSTDISRMQLRSMWTTAVPLYLPSGILTLNPGEANYVLISLERYARGCTTGKGIHHFIPFFIISIVYWHPGAYESRLRWRPLCLDDNRELCMRNEFERISRISSCHRVPQGYVYTGPVPRSKNRTVYTGPFRTGLERNRRIQNWTCWFAGPVLDPIGYGPARFIMVPRKHLNPFQMVPCKRKPIRFGLERFPSRRCNGRTKLPDTQWRKYI